MFTTAEQRAIDQLSTESGRLAVVAVDQRTKLVEALQAAGLESRMDFMRAYKLDLVSALAPAAPAMLLDPEIALPHVTDAGALPAHTGLLVSLERSGSRPTPGALRSARPLPRAAADGAPRLGATAAELAVRASAAPQVSAGSDAAL